jgi:hypothetical protein
MKIVITEDQARRLNILNADSDPIVKLEQYVKLKSDIVDKLYNNFVNLSLAELLSPEFEVTILPLLNEIETQTNQLSNLAYRYLDGMNDEESDGLDIKIDEASRNINDKISGLEMIVSKVQELKELSNQYKVSNVFKFQEPLDITDQQ